MNDRLIDRVLNVGFQVLGGGLWVPVTASAYRRSFQEDWIPESHPCIKGKFLKMLVRHEFNVMMICLFCTFGLFHMMATMLRSCDQMVWCLFNAHLGKWMQNNRFNFIGRSGAEKDFLSPTSRRPLAAMRRCVSLQAVPAWAAVTSHPYRPPGSPDSGSGACDITWPGGGENQNNSTYNSSDSCISRPCAEIHLHVSATGCREVWTLLHDRSWTFWSSMACLIIYA